MRPRSGSGATYDRSLTLTTSVDGRVATICLEGRLSARNGLALLDDLTRALQLYDRVLVDLAAVIVALPTWYALFGLAVHRAGGWPHARLGLVAPDAQQRQHLRASGVADHVAIADDHRLALQRCEHRPRIVWACWSFAHDPAGPARARHAVAAKVHEWQMADRVELDDLALVVEELTANVVDHAGGPFTVTVRLDHDVLHVVVGDEVARPPVLQPFDPAAVRGRGLQMVAAIATSWGWRPTASGKQTWAQLPLVVDQSAGGPAGCGAGSPEPEQ
ncbi:ATP-binding protein [Pseudonocardia sp. N23]|uniref:ATP-binding protein n=1 Tax=Pseudonocardia sp. N23 TaxID=1987376 RepID=UPI000BFE10A8|nr:ATP-binding protein [Pseudonocardia sp. N23]GAY13003.1 probable regulatory protein [Pseudonocardia sp. N23]